MLYCLENSGKKTSVLVQCTLIFPKYLQAGDGGSHGLHQYRAPTVYYLLHNTHTHSRLAWVENKFPIVAADNVFLL